MPEILEKTQTCTIGAVAKLARVSPMSVTRTFSSPDKVSERIKSKVLAAAKELGYRPNILARTLRGGKSMTVGIMWSLCGPHDSVEVVREMSKTLFDHGYVSYISDSYSDPKIVKETLRNFTSRKIDGLILHADYPQLINDEEIQSILKEIPATVVVGRKFYNCPFDEITLNLLPALDEIVSYWASCGRKKIYYMVNPSLKERIEHFKQCLERHGLDSQDHCIPINYYNNRDIGGDFQKAFEQHVSGRKDCDAILCACDEGAAGLMDYLRNSGVKVPQDIAVCGWNDSQLSAYYNPRMASVERKALEVMRLATSMLLARLKGDRSPIKKHEIQMKFINRESAG
jgi:DNA-binding LacI/PurR family transcriptional regulator